MGTRRDQAEAAASPASTPECVQCGRPVVRSHRCPATPQTSLLHGPPEGWRYEVETERRWAALDDDEAWQEEPLPLDPIEEPDRPPPPPPP